MTDASRDRLILAAILCLALALRLVGLNGPLWFDEVVTHDTHLRLGWGQMLSSYSMNHHYLHNIAAKLSMSLFGDLTGERAEFRVIVDRSCLEVHAAGQVLTRVVDAEPTVQLLPLRSVSGRRRGQLRAAASRRSR